MKHILTLFLILIIISCDDTEYFEFPEINYKFNMDGRTSIDNNGYYHLTINPLETQQTLHRFGAEITNIDKWGLPSQVVLR
jgi:hypothetical protein